MKKKYRILVDYGSYEGMKFWDDNGYNDLDEAVKEAQSIRSEFYIIKIVNWMAIE